MFKQVISKDRRDLLELLGRQGVLKNFYLAGGTAAAIHMGHRISDDFDFFSRHDFETFGIIQCLSDLGAFTLDRRSPWYCSRHLKRDKVKFFILQASPSIPGKDILRAPDCRSSVQIFGILWIGTV